MRWILFAPTLPWALTTWIIGMLSAALFLAYKPRFEQAAVLTMEWRPWFARLWRYSTTLGRCVWYQPGARDRRDPLDEPLERHENVHVRQVEDMMLLALLVSVVVTVATGDWLLGLIMWWSGGAWQLPNFVTAVLRFGWKGIYRDAEHERSAYAQTALWPTGSSWWEWREKRRERQKGI